VKKILKEDIYKSLKSTLIKEINKRPFLKKQKIIYFIENKMTYEQLLNIVLNEHGYRYYKSEVFETLIENILIENEEEFKRNINWYQYGQYIEKIANEFEDDFKEQLIELADYLVGSNNDQQKLDRIIDLQASLIKKSQDVINSRRKDYIYVSTKLESIKNSIHKIMTIEDIDETKQLTQQMNRITQGKSPLSWITTGIEKLTAVEFVSILLYRISLKKELNKCESIEDINEKKRCGLRKKIEASDKVISMLNKGYYNCRNTSNIEKCENRLKKKIKKWNDIKKSHQMNLV